MGKQYVGVSTKAYLGYHQTLDWLAETREAVLARPGLADAGVVPFVIPSFPLLPAALQTFRDTGVIVGAQNVAWGDGPLTGEVPASMLAELGVGLAEIGHAERRDLFGETDDVVALKYRVSSHAGLTALLCVGEPQRLSPADAAEHCARQVTAAVPAGARGDLLLAYEPIWAIGADAPADPDYVTAVVRELRARLEPAYPDLALSILYGGSAGPGLIARLDGVDGLFLGRFAHDAANFARVLDEASVRSP
jgi:triosephosphate isomerase